MFSPVPLKFNNVSPDDEQYIKDTLKRLESKSGVIDLKRTKKVLNDWSALIINEYNANKTNKTNLAKALFAGRCCQIALRCIAIIYLLADEKEGSLTDQWAFYFAEKALHGMVVLYGDKIANNKANQAINKSVKQYKAADKKKAIVAQLPDNFTVDDVCKVLESLGNAHAPENGSNMISILKKAGLVKLKS